MTRLIGVLDSPCRPRFCPAAAGWLLPVSPCCSAMAAARSRGSYRARRTILANDLRALCREAVHGGNARPHAPCRRHVRAPSIPSATRARLARAGVLIGLVHGRCCYFGGGQSRAVLAWRAGEIRRHQHPGYFLIKLAVWVLAGLILCQAIIDIARRAGAPVPHAAWCASARRPRSC